MLEPAAQSDDGACNSNNISAPVCVGVSITSHSAVEDTDAGNLSLRVPQDGGFVVGKQIIKVTSNNVSGVGIDLRVNSDDTTSLVNTGNSDWSIRSNEKISRPDPDTLGNNRWGVALPMSQEAILLYDSAIIDPTQASNLVFSGLPTMNDDEHKLSTGRNTNGEFSNDVYYGVRVDDPGSLLAGDYKANVIYTVTTNEVPAPTITSITPNTYKLGSGEDSTVTITGTNLLSTNRVNIETTNNTEIDCTNINVIDDTELTCQMPTDDNSIINPGTYTVYIKTQAEKQGKLEKGFEYTRQSICRNADPDSDCQVDIDDNMIPVTYVGYDGNGRGHWAVVGDADIQSNLGSWYNYRSGQWANAVTVQNPSKYTNAATGTEVDNNDVLGYWVYIPRYAYEVQRRDAVDRVVDPQNFDIVFQTADKKNTPAPSCNSADSVWVDDTPVKEAGPDNTSILSKDYRTGCWPNNRTYVANSDNTTWATNPAFTWGNTELNGIWVGKYETTGTRTAPTVKPNQHANISEYIGEFYSAAKSIGVEDSNNVGGGARTDDTTDGLTQNSHHLAKATSHMLKNSEWGAITYLAHSKYGAGINTSYTRKSNVSKNGAYPSSSADADGTSSKYGITGCGPVSAGSISYYTDGTPLSADVIESSTACSQDLTRAYNGSLGVLSSATNTVYGVYGLSGGAGEYVMGNKTTSDTQSGGSTSYMKTPAQPPYVDLYKSSSGFGANPSWSSDSSESLYNYDVCTFETCGGTATYETTTVQSVSGGTQSWDWTYSLFVASSYPWFGRGGYSDNSSASPFYTAYDYGRDYPNYGSRATLLALPAGQ